MSDEFDGDEGFKNLRKAYEATQTELKEARKALEKVSQKERTQSLTEIFKAKGIKESAATHYTGDVSEEAVVKWATEVGIPVTDPEAGKESENQSAAARALAAAGGASNYSARAEVTPGQRVLGDPEEILALLNANLPYEEYVKLGMMPANPNQI